MRLIGNPNELPSGATVTGDRLTQARSCSVIPNRTTDPEGFIETAQGVVSFGAVKEMARMVGWASPEEVAELTAEFEEKIADQAEKYEALKNNAAEVIELQKARDLVAAADAEEAIA